MRIVSSTSIDDIMFDLTKRLWKRATMAETERYLAPLYWYINTGRAPLVFLRPLVNADGRKQVAIINRLMKAGTYEDAVDSVYYYLTGTKHSASF